MRAISAFGLKGAVSSGCGKLHQDLLPAFYACLIVVFGHFVQFSAAILASFRCANRWCGA
jgi:hypothetical protein